MHLQDSVMSHLFLTTIFIFLLNPLSEINNKYLQLARAAAEAIGVATSTDKRGRARDRRF